MNVCRDINGVQSGFNVEFITTVMLFLLIHVLFVISMIWQSTSQSTRLIWCLGTSLKSLVMDAPCSAMLFSSGAIVLSMKVHSLVSPSFLSILNTSTVIRSWQEGERILWHSSEVQLYSPASTSSLWEVTTLIDVSDYDCPDNKPVD